MLRGRQGPMPLDLSKEYSEGGTPVSDPPSMSASTVTPFPVSGHNTMPSFPPGEAATDDHDSQARATAAAKRGCRKSSFSCLTTYEAAPMFSSTLLHFLLPRSSLSSGANQAVMMTQVHCPYSSALHQTQRCCFIYDAARYSGSLSPYRIHWQALELT
ncbi:hypothetical protein PYCCODRAFT_405195 [Trametes coccinea BRFM310]|uniref:Uncharacterized protein n=1 Tax=Trametes coccinea (strain BRFM310) TaxID=1353009 RepID=A0A1Y2IPB9_TRAC3|nr:hypothetical protein PYCCODRAFT_405195 [Trametes coccinea BRFM310]